MDSSFPAIFLRKTRRFQREKEDDPTYKGSKVLGDRDGEMFYAFLSYD